MDTDLNFIVGKLMKVKFVDDKKQIVYVRFQNGQDGNVTGLTDCSAKRGDIILVGEKGEWEIAPPETWPESNSIAIIKSVLDDASVLIDNGYKLETINNHNNVNIESKNTVEYNDVDGIIRVISNIPLRSRDNELDKEEELKLYRVEKSSNGPTFNDFGGYPHVVERARQLIETQFKSRKYLDKIGARPVKGVLFTGPPGTGKTYLAKIIAQETNADFFLVSGPSIISKWLGDTEETLRIIFEAATASKSGRAIIFFDEIDSIAERRTGDSHEASKRLVAQLLTLMDGFDDKSKSVIIIAATNRVEALDPALTRPGRFDWEVEFDKPSIKDRLEILKVGVQRLQTVDELPIEDIAFLAEGWSAADLDSIWTEAALLAAGDKRDKIAPEDLAQAYERIAARPQRDKIKESI